MNKTKRIAIRVSEEEYKILKEKSKNYGLNISRFLRDLSLNYPLTCIVDQRVIKEMLNIAGDIGRLGGLFKYWLTLNYDEKPNFSDKRSYDDIDKIVDEILELQDLLKQEALKLMKEIDDN